MSNSNQEMTNELSRELRELKLTTESKEANDNASGYLYRKFIALQQEIALDAANKTDDMEIDMDVNEKIRQLDLIRKEQRDTTRERWLMEQQQQRQIQQLHGVVPRCRKTLNF